MGLNDGFNYPALKTDTQTRVIVLAPGNKGPIHCFHIIIDLDADWELKGATSQVLPSTREHNLSSYVEVADVKGFTVPIFPLYSDHDGHVHPFQRYTALSYVWGDQSRSHKIFLNGKAFYVGDNLHTALMRLRRRVDIAVLSRPDKLTDSDNKRVEALYRHLLPAGRLLWIDAMSIDQANLLERKAQVKLMSRIYRQADYVHADLGYAGEGGRHLFRLLKIVIDAGKACDSYQSSRFAFNNTRISGDSQPERGFISAIESHWQNIQSPESTFTAPDLPPPSGQSLEAQGIPLENDTIWSWWRLLMDSQYFRRLWVIQEFALAKGITLWFSDCGIDPNMIVDCIRYLSKYSINRGLYLSADTTSTSNENASTAGIAGFANMAFQRNLIHTPTHSDSEQACLLEKLSLARETLATDLRDKIYGMLGLASDGPTFLSFVSYSTSIEAVYEDFAQSFVERGQGMEMLYQVDSRVSKTLQIPSWVPDWSRDMDESSIYKKRGRKTRFTACKAELPIIHLSKADSKLLVDGALFDTVKRLSKPLKHDCGKIEQFDFYKFLWEGGHLSLDLDQYPTGEAAPDIVLWTLLCNYRESKSDEEAHHLQESLWAVLGQMVSLASVGESQRPTWQPHTLDIMREGLPNTMGRSWCITQNGYFGLVPGGTKIGDRIAVFYGGPIPFIVRPQTATENTDFTLVGHGYLHGLMYGEAFDVDTFKPQKIVLV